MTRTTGRDLEKSDILEALTFMGDDDPIVVRIIAMSMIGFERSARALHVGHGASGTFTICKLMPCEENARQLNKIYGDIIAMRKRASSDDSVIQ